MKKSIILVTTGLLMTINAVAQTPQQRLQQLIATWVVVESTFTNPPQGMVVGVMAADGNALYTIWKQGSGESYYEANALWGYSEMTKQVRVFEVNTIGVAATHIGNFDDSGVLTLELHDPETNELLEQRTMHWTADTWKMTARFIINGEEVEHHVTLSRQEE